MVGIYTDNGPDTGVPVNPNTDRSRGEVPVLKKYYYFLFRLKNKH
jgi:hypothetical protein